MKLSLATALIFVCSGSAFAQTAFVARTGSGTACTSSAPCGNLYDAAPVSVGGTIFVVSPGFFGGAIFGSLRSLHGSGGGTILSYLALNTNARDFVLQDVGIARSIGSYGLLFGPPGGSLTAENVSFSYATGLNTSGVQFNPGGPATLTLKNVRFNNFANGTGAAIRIVTGGHNVNVTLDNVQVSGGIRGIVIDTSGGGWAKVNIENSSFTNITGPAIYGNAGSGNIRLYLDNVSATNSNVGVVMAGANALAWMTQSKIAGNATGIQQAAGAKIYSYKDNQIFNNSTDGTPLPASPSPAQSMPGNEIASAAGR